MESTIQKQKSMMRKPKMQKPLKRMIRFKGFFSYKY